MRSANRRALGRPQPVLLTLLTIILVVGQGLSIAQVASASAMLSVQSTQDTVPPPAPGEYPSHDYGDPAPEDSGDDPDGSGGKEHLPTAPLASPRIVGHSFTPPQAVSGMTLNFTYTVQLDSGQYVILRSVLRNSGGVWIADTARDLRVNLGRGTHVVSNIFIVPLTTAAGTYDVAWSLWSDGYGTLYDYDLEPRALNVIAPTPTATRTPTRTLTPTITRTSTRTLTPTITRTPTRTLTPTITRTPTRTSTPTITRTPTRTSTPTITRTFTRTLTPTITQTFTRTPTRTITRTFTRTLTPTATSTSTTTRTFTNTPAATATQTSTRTATLTATRVPSDTPTPTSTRTHTPLPPTATATSTGTNTLTATSTSTASYTASPTSTATNSHTPTSMPTGTATFTHTPTSTNTPTYTPTDTPISMNTPTPTDTPMDTPMSTPTSTPTDTPINTPTDTYTPTDTPTSTPTNTPTNTPTDTPMPTNIPTDAPTDTPTSTNTPTDTPTNTATNTPTDTPTNTPTHTATAMSTPTATPTQPTQPVLTGVEVAPAVAQPSGTLVLSYTVFSPGAQSVSLGAGIRPSGGNWSYDPANDRTVAVNPGSNVVTRTFSLPATPDVTYDVIWGLWSAGFGTQYGSQVRNGAVTVTGATPTPTFSPTNTPTPLPTEPSLLGVAFSPASVNTGAMVTLSYTVYSPAASQYVLGSVIRNSTDSYDDPGNNRLVSVPAGISVVTRPFYIVTNAAPGAYDVVFGLWNANFSAQHGGQLLPGALTIVAATPTPTVPIPTPTATNVPAPNGPAVVLTNTGPAGGQTVNVGGAFTLNYTLNNTTGSTAPVKLAALISPSGMEGYGALEDTANQSTVNVPPGVHSYSRQFQVPSTAGQGGYDLTWSLLDSETNSVHDTITAKNHTWVNVQSATSFSLSLVGTSLEANNITLQDGVVNRITTTFTINNTSGAPAKVILRTRIRGGGNPTWISDLPSDALVSVPVGVSAFSRGFAVPRYAATGSYDVIWELGNPSFTGTIDSDATFNALQITNPAQIANRGVPILMYHNINPTTAGGNWVSISNFTQQMDYLQSDGWSTITGEELYEYIYKGVALPAKAVWLTFDDSYKNIYEYAYPVMQARGQRGSIFAVTQYMGQMNSWDLGSEPQHLHMTWNMLQALQGAGFAADSHTRHHVRLHEATGSVQQGEIWGTQRDLVSFTGNPAGSFSYPYGTYNDETKWLVAHSGFHAATTVLQVKQHTDYADMFALTRIGISDSDTLATFAGKLNQP